MTSSPPGTRSKRVLSIIGVICMLVLLTPGSADGHGAQTRPGSRTYLCRIDGTHASGDINPSNAACAAAVALGGKQPLWDWFGVLRSDGAGRTRGYIPDGQLCSGGEPKFAGYDLPRSDWPYTRLTSGAELAVRYNAWAAHPGEFRLYVTKDGYDPTKPLGWDDLEDQPFSVYNQDSPNGNDDQNGTPDYQWNVNLPNKTGQHIIYSVWSRSDSNETFYGCSDVRFDGGNGQVVGVGAGANPVGAPAQAPAVVTPATTPPTSMPQSSPSETTAVAQAPADAAPVSSAAPTKSVPQSPTPANAAAEDTEALPAGAGSLDPAEASPADPSTSDQRVDNSVLAGASAVSGNELRSQPLAVTEEMAVGSQTATASSGPGWLVILTTALAGIVLGIVMSIVGFSVVMARRPVPASPVYGPTNR